MNTGENDLKNIAGTSNPATEIYLATFPFEAFVQSTYVSFEQMHQLGMEL